MSYYCKIQVLDSKFRWDSLSKIKEFQAKFQPKEPRMGLPGDLVKTVYDENAANFELVGIGSFYFRTPPKEGQYWGQHEWVHDGYTIKEGGVHDVGINHMLPYHKDVKDFFQELAEYFDFELFISAEGYLPFALKEMRKEIPAGVKNGYVNGFYGDKGQESVMWLVTAKKGIVRTHNLFFKLGSEVTNFTDE